MPSKQFSLCALIPTYNNAATIVDVARRVCNVLDYVIVVVDGSTDDTLELLKASGLTLDVIVFPKNRGKGGALKIGFERAKEQGFDYCLTIDGDGQHYPEDIPAMIDELSHHTERTLLVGARSFNHNNMPAGNTFANKFSNFWFRVDTGLKLSDTQSGLRIYPVAHIGSCRWLTNRYESELELLVWAAWHNVNIVETPVRVYYPPREERVSHFRPFRDFARISVLNVLLLLPAILYGRPARVWRSVWCFSVAFFVFAYVSLLSMLRFAFCGRNEASFNRQHKTNYKAVRFIGKNVAGASFELPLETDGTDSEPELIIANHNSVYDVMFALSLRPNLVALTKGKWSEKSSATRSVIHSMQFIPAEGGIDAILDKCRTVVEKGYSILVFPEGTRSMDGRVQTFHRGAFYIAERLGLPIRPLLIEGTYDLLNKHHFHVNPSPVIMTALPQVMPDDNSLGSNYRERARQFRKLYQQKLSRTCVNLK